MSLTEEQLRLLDSCPALKGLKDWFIGVDTAVNPSNDESTDTTTNTDNSNTENSTDTEEPNTTETNP